MNQAPQRMKAGIIGGAGYTGGEMLRLLLRHPGIDLAFVHSQSHAGQAVHAVHGDLLGETDISFAGDVDQDVDVLFLCLGHGDSRKLLSSASLGLNIRIIDLSQDFRLADDARLAGREFVYGLPELNRQAIQEARHIANPGCFATAIQLALLPLANAGLAGEVHATGITGSTGAGQYPSPGTHFSWRANNIQPYKTLQHQHMAEVAQSLGSFRDSKTQVHFVPWRGDFTRGIFISATMDCSLGIDAIMDLFRDYYSTASFTHLSPRMIDLKQVVNTNKCLVHPEKVGDKLVVHAAIDNLLKGAAGQAVQNMNLMFGFDERAGLELKATSF